MIKIKKVINIINKKKILVAENKKHLRKLIKKEMKKHGNDCDLNHIDVSNITDMSYLFNYSEFNGDISEWNTANVIEMDSMFDNCAFNGDISKWNTSNVKDMSYMFANSQFNSDISDWDVSNVEDMRFMFSTSDFINGYINSWNTSVPYWAKIENFKDRVAAIDAYHTKSLLDKNVNNNGVLKNAFKI